MKDKSVKSEGKIQLNTIKPAAGAKRVRRRVGRGIGSGSGKTAGRGHKGQRARSGGFHKVGFEGGQMPLHRRLPKRGFKSLTQSLTAQVCLSEINKLAESEIDLSILKKTNLIPQNALRAKVILSGEIKRKVVLNNILVTRGAKSAIEAAGGKVIVPTQDPAGNG